jgi:plastocyanin
MKSKAPHLAVAILLAVAMLAYRSAEAAPGSPDPMPAANPPIDAASVGSIAGVVKFQGTPPKPTRVIMAADPSCAKLHPSGVVTDDVLVGPDGALANVIVYISDGLGGRTFEPPKQEATIEQKGCMYSPHIIAVQANQPIRVVNGDQVTHNIHPLPHNNREWNKSQPPGMEPVTEVFAREEIAIPVKCNVHPWMKAYVAVLKHPYFAATGKDGQFELKNLPPGEYTIQAWHEKLGSVTQHVTVGSREKKEIQLVLKGGS